ncbi:hypothetical protein CkaCkLH20_12533 [Colletotrichum karsti]|uniref:Monooxygenase n=1 Tax=Colletotrichum karsti TaxID=1095194 RepID=A0A9P6LCW3_9PEZI|nr:uncharacterized protein CkaCkLH20_12533 [Colletotrichum karsti]KAF9869924.1 hypothetical protein CkaCkLH20_12533 [Colletotrichum karsti]
MSGITESYDAIIVGAGIAGINAAYRFQEAFPLKPYAILESRNELGGTWSIFQYPGIRSDSDLYTLSFGWDPWSEADSIAPVQRIMSYLWRITRKHGIEPHIKFNRKVLSANWDSHEHRWTLQVNADGYVKSMTATYLYMGTGYYDGTNPYEAHIQGIERFRGAILHPQFWPKDYDYSGQKVVIIGSGATAVTMLPAMHEKAEKVTMLQRSPGYVLSLPQKDWMRTLTRLLFPRFIANALIRFRYIASAYAIFILCKMFPAAVRKYVQAEARSQLPEDFPVEKHFAPKYNPWDQRFCIAPDGDFYKCLGTNKAAVVTDEIQTVTEDGILLRSGSHIPADLIVTATGLRVRFLGNINITIDGGQPVRISEVSF